MAKAKKIPHLNPEKDLVTCLRKILHSRFNEMISFEEGTIEGKDISRLHDMRVASRRVQAVMKVFNRAFPKKKFKQQYQTICGIKDILGAVRHYDVFIALLQKNKPKYAHAGRKAIELLEIRQKSLREAARKEMIRYFTELNRKNYKDRFFAFCRLLE